MKISHIAHSFSSFSPESKEKMAFSTPLGHWKYKVLLFGLHGAPGTFQRMMDILLRPTRSNLVINSGSWKEHLARLRKILVDTWKAVLAAWAKRGTSGAPATF